MSGTRSSILIYISDRFGVTREHGSNIQISFVDERQGKRENLGKYFSLKRKSYNTAVNSAPRFAQGKLF